VSTIFHDILFLRTFYLISTLSDCWGKCHLTFLEVAGKTGCFPATSCAPKYVFTHNIGINSPFLRAINLFSYSPQDGTSSSRHFVLSPPDAYDADADADATYPINPSIR